MTSRRTADVVILHGAWHQPAHWSDVVERLTAAGVSVEVPDLGGLALERATEAVQRIVDARPDDDPPLLVAHSNGGIAGGTIARVKAMLLFSAWILDAGESPRALIEAMGVGAQLMATHDEDGLLALDRDTAGDRLYGDCPEPVAERALDLLRPEPPVIFAATPTSVTWRETPTVYIDGTEDRATPSALRERFAARCASTLSWPTSHSPYLSRPDAVVELIRAHL